jgi:hypothetical protein
MFLTANALAIKYGIDDRIAKFFVDRDPPAGNLYWKDKELYLRPKPGYIFLPLIVDLFNRSGLSLDWLLGETFIGTIEKIVHYAAKEECGLIDKSTATRSCREVVAGNAYDNPFLNEVTSYLGGEENFISKAATPFPALHRGDIFLFSLCVLELTGEKQRELVKTWFALISTLLLMDDAEDFLDDRATGDENAFIQSGSNREGFERIQALLTDNFDRISMLNAAMADALQRSFSSIADKPGIKEYLNS